MEETKQTTLKHYLIISVFIALAIIIFGLLWLFFLSPSNPSGFGWFLFSFAAGLSMIVLPCTLPLAFVMVPLSMGKGIAKGLGIALAFGLGITITLSFYGVLAAIVGKVAIDSLGVSLEIVKNWVYFVAGIFALLFALGEIGLLKFRMPSYTGAAPAFIQKRQDFLKAFFLGLFLGNIGVGCPHPATPLILIEIASSGSVLYGWLLFFVHAVGRVLPLLFLAALGILGVNGLTWLVARKDKIEKATGWAMVFVAGFILTLGLFSHKWWVNSGIHTQLEKITHEEALLDIIRDNLNSTVAHTHGFEVGTGLFNLPLWLGSWFMLAVWIIPIWWWWFRKRRDIKIISDSNMVPEKVSEERVLSSNKYLLLALSALLVLVFLYVLPRNFVYEQTAMPHEHTLDTSADHPHDEDMTAHMEDMTEDEMDYMMMDDDVYGVMLHEESTITEGLVVNLTPPKEVKVNEPSNLNFFINLLPSKEPVLDLTIEHEKYIHVIGIRDDLTNFFHIHPSDLGEGKWGIEYTFTKGGIYKVWSDVTYRGAAHSFGHASFEVEDPNLRVDVDEPDYIAFAKNVVVDKYQVSPDYPEPIVMGRSTPIDFSLRDFTGNGIEIEPYLGASMHLAVIKDDLKQYIHTHPADHHQDEDSSAPTHDDSDGHHGLINNLFVKQVFAHGTAPEDVLPTTHISFNVDFPEAGIYKMFAQFRPKGIDLPPDQSLVAEFYIEVLADGPAYQAVLDDHQTSATSSLSKVSITLISLVLIVILGWASYKFINVKS